MTPEVLSNAIAMGAFGVSACSFYLSWRAKKHAQDTFWRDTRAELRLWSLEEPEECGDGSLKWPWSLTNCGRGAAVDVELEAQWGNFEEEKQQGGGYMLRKVVDGIPLGYIKAGQWWQAKVLEPYERREFGLAYALKEERGPLVVSWTEIRGTKDVTITDEYEVVRKLRGERKGEPAEHYYYVPERVRRTETVKQRLHCK